MIKIEKCLRSFTRLVFIASIGLAAPASAQDFAITRLEIRGIGITVGSAHPNGMSLIVPDVDTTLPAYGTDSRLRRYDVHLAKMVEVTLWACDRLSSSEERRSDRTYAWWIYKANNGETLMGRYKITCQLAGNLAVAYGINRTGEATEITFLSKNEPVRVQQIWISTLQITGDKIDRWLDFAQNFTPLP